MSDADTDFGKGGTTYTMSVEDIGRTRATLLNSLKDPEDQRAWFIFHDLYHNLIFSVCRRAGLAEHAAAEVTQDTLLTVNRSINTFRYDPERGSFRGWLYTVIRSRIIDWIRGQKKPDGSLSARQPASNTSAHPLDSVPSDPELEKIWDGEWAGAIVEAADKVVREKINAKHYQCFQLCVGEEWAADDVARELGIKRDLVYLNVHRVKEALREEIRRLERTGGF